MKIDRTQMGWWNIPGAIDEDIAALPEHRAGEARAARFCLVRLAEEEADARAATDYGASWRAVPGRATVRAGGAGEDDIAVGTAQPVGAHIARQDPAATLARISTLRRMIAYAVGPTRSNDRFFEGEATAKGNMIYMLVDFWPDHPGRAPSWADPR